MKNFFPGVFFLVMTVTMALSSCKNNVVAWDGSAQKDESYYSKARTPERLFTTLFAKQATGGMFLDIKYDEPEGDIDYYIISESSRSGFHKNVPATGLKKQQQWIVCKSQFMRVRPETFLKEHKAMEKAPERKPPVITSHVLAAKFDND